MAKFSGFAKGGSFGGYLNGLAKFKNNGEDWKIKLIKEDKVLEFHEKLLPEFPKVIRTGGDSEYFVSLKMETNSKGEISNKIEEIANIRPARWDSELFLVADVTRDNETNIPKFYTKTVNYGGGDEEKHMVNWFLQFQEGEYKGVLVPYNVHYRFQNDGDGHAEWDFTEWSYNHPKATRIHQVVEFYVEQMGVLSDQWPIEWPEDGNIIPELYARIMDKKQYLRCSGKDGYVIPDTLHTVKVEDKAQPAEEATEEASPQKDEDWEEEDW